MYSVDVSASDFFAMVAQIFSIGAVSMSMLAVLGSSVASTTARRLVKFFVR